MLVDDPLRSVQSLPGVVASDEFEATFAVRGLGFDNVGLYIDGVLMTAPFHTIRDANDGYSLTLVNGDVVDQITLLAGSAPARYGERTGSVLGLKLREGSRDEFFGRASLGATGVYATLEGPLGASKKTSWLLSARKSYLDYVLDRSGHERVRARLLRRDRAPGPSPEPIADPGHRPAARTLALAQHGGRPGARPPRTRPTPAPTSSRCSTASCLPRVPGSRASRSFRARPA